MAWYVDNGAGRFTEFDANDLDGAKAMAEESLRSAKEFRAKMGFVPFWGKATELRRGAAGLYRKYGCTANAEVEANTKLVKRYTLEAGKGSRRCCS